MTRMTLETYRGVLDRAKLLISAARVERALDELMRGTGARGGALGRAQEVIVRRGEGGGGEGRVLLPGGRDRFWVELVGGRPLDPAAPLAVGMVLEWWVVREELKQARFAERRRLWEVESLRAIAEALGGTLEPQRIAEELGQP